MFGAVTGRPVPGLPSSAVSRLLDSWSREYSDWNARDMTSERRARVWVDGVFVRARGEGELPPAGRASSGRTGPREAGCHDRGPCGEHRQLAGAVYQAEGPGPGAAEAGGRGRGLRSLPGMPKVFPDCRRPCRWGREIKDSRRYLPKRGHAEAARDARDISVPETRIIQLILMILKDQIGFCLQLRRRFNGF